MTTSKNRSIRKIFIANRGEIARRIAQTAKKLGIESVALTDKPIPPLYLSEFVTQVLSVEEESTQLYLNAELMIHYAKISGADAVHPGFGFLSENSQFAQMVLDAGFTWIGPSPKAIEAMASKATARDHANQSNVPCLPGLNGLDLDKDKAGAVEQLKSFAAKTGFPLLLKAAYGGGGKGMRVVYKSEELTDQASLAAAEAKSSFGNGSLIVEKYLPAPRHVEVQVMADQQGNIVIFGDRDCSLQRRHQKILEEAPAPNIPDTIRKSMHDAARELAKAVRYDNAGTVEFLLDESNPNRVQFYFLEMNTRLQVEHTVTEEVFGVDLVEWQIKVAQGETLPSKFTNLEPRGHAIEVRIYAEDPGNNFFPAPGPVRAFVPATGRGIRWEIGMDTVDEISTKFDPMISKLVCTAGDRTQALDLLLRALERTLFAGPRNNVPFLMWLARHPQVRKNPVDTHFIGSHIDEALDWELNARKSAQNNVDRLAGFIKRKFVGNSLKLNSATLTHDHITTSSFARDGLSASTVLGGQMSIDITSSQTIWSPYFTQTQSNYGFGLLHSGGPIQTPFGYVQVRSPEMEEHWVALLGHNWVFSDERKSLGFDGKSGDQTSDGMIAPVPGKVVQVQLQVGKPVKPGDVLFVLESMKMQFEVKATKEGAAKGISVSVGDQVMAGQTLGEWEL